MCVCVCVGGRRDRLKPAEACVNSPSAGSSTCRRLNASWHLPSPDIPALRRAVRGGQVHVRVCLCLCVCLCTRKHCLPSIDGAHQTAAGGVCLASTLLWFIQSAFPISSGASCHPGSCLSLCMEHQKAEGGGTTLTHPDTKQGEGQPAPAHTPAAFISSFAGICGGVSSRWTSLPITAPVKEPTSVSASPKTSILVNV